MTEAFTPTSQEFNVVPGPIFAPAATEVGPSSVQLGRMVTSGSSSTSTSSQVVAESRIATPSRIHCALMRSRMMAAASASWYRSFTPRISFESAHIEPATTAFSSRRKPITSVRYSSPCELFVVMFARSRVRSLAAKQYMPELISPMNNSSADASLCSTMRSTPPVSSRTMRP